MTRVFVAIILTSIAMTACAGADTTGSRDANCPITIPSGEFVPPAGYPPVPSTAGSGDVWFGTDALFTVLPADGSTSQRKSVWWSSEFPGGSEEEQPPITVTWTRLDDPSVTRTHAPGTNAYTVPDGWFMIAGIDPDEPGCWKVEAAYKGATLTYVYEQA